MRTNNSSNEVLGSASAPRLVLPFFAGAHLAAASLAVYRVCKIAPPCPDAKAATAIAKATGKIDPAKIGKKCPTDTIATLGLTGGCANAASASELASCIVTEAGAVADSALAAEYGQPSNTLATSEERKCQGAIATATGRQYANTRLKLFSACLAKKDKGRVASCLDEGSQTKLDKAGATAGATMLKRCTDALVPTVRSARCATATTAAEFAACQIATHDTETARLITLLP